MKGGGRQEQGSRIRGLRIGLQLLTLTVVLWIGVEFALWVDALREGRSAGARPPGVEGFLPISALMSLRHWVETGVATRIHPAGLVLLLLILASALLLKKSFCSWLCPVGTVAEWLGAAGRRLRLARARLPRWLDLPLRGVKYLLLAFFLHAIFWRMTTVQIGAFLDSPYNRVADVKMLLFFTEMSPLAAKVMAGLVVLSVVIPFFWCRYLCPYGALLGLLSAASPLKVTRRPRSCTDCGLCSRACPSLLPVATSGRISSPECTGCLDCLAVCPAPAALHLAAPAPWRRAVRPALLACLLSLLFFGGIGVAKLAGYWDNDISAAEYARRVREIDHPRYEHFRGQVPAQTALE